MPGELTYLTLAENQPELLISKVINQYFYKHSEPVISRRGVLYEKTPDLELEESEPAEKVSKYFGIEFSLPESTTIELRRKIIPDPEENKIIDQLLEDVLPHGYTEA